MWNHYWPTSAFTDVPNRPHNPPTSSSLANGPRIHASRHSNHRWCDYRPGVNSDYNHLSCVRLRSWPPQQCRHHSRSCQKFGPPSFAPNKDDEWHALIPKTLKSSPFRDCTLILWDKHIPWQILSAWKCDWRKSEKVSSPPPIATGRFTDIFGLPVPLNLNI